MRFLVPQLPVSGVTVCLFSVAGCRLRSPPPRMYQGTPLAKQVPPSDVPMLRSAQWDKPAETAGRGPRDVLAGGGHHGSAESVLYLRGTPAPCSCISSRA